MWLTCLGDEYSSERGFSGGEVGEWGFHEESTICIFRWNPDVSLKTKKNDFKRKSDAFCIKYF